MRITCMIRNVSKVIAENYAHYGKTWMLQKCTITEIIVLVILSPWKPIDEQVKHSTTVIPLKAILRINWTTYCVWHRDNFLEIETSMLPSMKTNWESGMDYGFSVIRMMMWIVGVWPLQWKDIFCTFRWIVIFIVEVRQNNIKVVFFLKCSLRR